MPVVIEHVKKAKPGAVFGIDVSTKTGLVVIDPSRGSEKMRLIDVSDIKGVSHLETRCLRMEALFTQMREWIVATNPVIAVIEGYGYANQNSLAVLVELGTIVRGVLFNHKVPMVEVGPNALKKFVLGKGGGKKDEVRLGAYKKWKFEHASDDVVDAYVLARIGLCLTNQLTTKNKAELEVLEAIRNPPVKVRKKKKKEDLGSVAGQPD